MLRKHCLYNECIAEFSGTFLFVAFGIGCVAALKLTAASYGQWEISIIWGVAVALAVYLTAGISGAHLNPSVTIPFAVFGNFPRQKIIPYIVAQMFGAFAAAMVVYGLYSSLFLEKNLATAGIFTTFPHQKISFAQAFMIELFITALLVGGIFGLGDDKNGVARGALAPLLIGLLVAVIGSAFGPLTGFSMNAARDFAPRLFTTLAGWGAQSMTGAITGAMTETMTGTAAGEAAGAGRLPYALVPLTAPVIGGLFGAFFYTKVLEASLTCRPPAATEKQNDE